MAGIAVAENTKEKLFLAVLLYSWREEFFILGIFLLYFACEITQNCIFYNDSNHIPFLLSFQSEISDGREKTIWDARLITTQKSNTECKYLCYRAFPKLLGFANFITWNVPKCFKKAAVHWLSGFTGLLIFPSQKATVSGVAFRIFVFLIACDLQKFGKMVFLLYNFNWQKT